VVGLRHRHPGRPAGLQPGGGDDLAAPLARAVGALRDLLERDLRQPQEQVVVLVRPVALIVSADLAHGVGVELAVDRLHEEGGAQAEATVGSRHSTRRGQRPRQEGQEGHAEELQRAERHVLVREEAVPREVQQMVVHERVPEEAGVAHLHHRVPRHRDHQQQQHAPPRRPRRHRPLAREEEEERDDGQRLFLPVARHRQTSADHGDIHDAECKRERLHAQHAERFRFSVRYDARRELARLEKHSQPYVPQSGYPSANPRAEDSLLFKRERWFCQWKLGKLISPTCLCSEVCPRRRRTPKPPHDARRAAVTRVP